MEGCILGKAILIISAGLEAVPGIMKAKEMGLHVVVSDMDLNAPGFEFADDRILASTYDYTETARLAREYNDNVNKIDGVIALSADVPYTVAYVAKSLGLPGLSLETASLSSDKLEMKDKLKAMGIPLPHYWRPDNITELKKIVEKQGLPLIIKPIDSRGARGVFLLTNVDMLEWAFEHSQNQSPSSKVIVEEYLEGPQISTEALIINGVGYPIGFSDRNYEYLNKFSPYIIENGGDMPTSLNDLEKNIIAKTAIDAGISMGVVNGVVKGDMVLTSEGPKVIEIATRLSGGWFSSDQIPLNSGIHIIEYAIKIALNINFSPTDLVPKINNGVAIRYFFPNEGQISKIENLDILLDKDYIYKFELYVKEGDYIEKITDHTKRAGYVITIGKDKKEAVNRAEEIVNTIKIITK